LYHKIYSDGELTKKSCVPLLCQYNLLSDALCKI
jgi:hypothetical protein